MALAAEDSPQTALASRQGSRVFRVLLATVLMAIAANCFLKYLWWTACYSAWYGIPKLAAQWRAAGVRASFNEWSLIVLDVASMAILFTTLRSRSTNRSGFLSKAPRLILSFMITLAVTGLFALALAWVKQGIQ